MSPADRKYTKDHEWAKEDHGLVRVGITDHAQHELGDVVYVELPKVGAETAQGKPFGVVESVKAASDLFAPVSGHVVEVNGNLESKPELVNQDPLGSGWMIVIRPSNLSELDALLHAQAYDALVAE
jgi:glycine cleavage system H protein